MEPRKLSKKEEKELQKQFPVIEEKATIWDIAVMIFWLVMALIMVYLFYLTFTYQV
jgi:cell division septal protein FtsQ